jgi:DNA-3-methyladenine glycosylase II
VNKSSHRTVQFEVTPLRPYSLERTLDRLQRFPERVDRFEEGIYRRLLFVRRSPLLLDVEQVAAPSRAVLRITLTGNDAGTDDAKRLAKRALERVLGIATDVRPFYLAFKRDPLLGPLVKRHLGLRVAGRLNLWETLLQIVLSQQINLALAHAMLADLAETMGRRAQIGGRWFYSFPSPRALGEADLDELGRLRLSRAKAETLKRLGAAFASGDLTEEELLDLPDEEAVARLTSYKGVGRWTAEFALLRGLGRMDVFPASDLGVVKYLAQGMLGYEGVAREEDMRVFADSWKPYRGLALIYAYAELAARSKPGGKQSGGKERKGKRSESRTRETKGKT